MTPLDRIYILGIIAFILLARASYLEYTRESNRKKTLASWSNYRSCLEALAKTIAQRNDIPWPTYSNGDDVHIADCVSFITRDGKRRRGMIDISPDIPDEDLQDYAGNDPFLVVKTKASRTGYEVISVTEIRNIEFIGEYRIRVE